MNKPIYLTSKAGLSASARQSLGYSLLMAAVLVLLSALMALAQTSKQTITGTVVDAKGGTLPGVNVVVQGTKTGTTTDANGAFSLAVPSEKSILLFSSIGFEKKAVQVGNKKSLMVTLTEDQSSLDEVVVVGYGEVRKKDLTGSVGKVNVEDMQRAPVPSYDQALAGRVAGVVVTSGDGQPGTTAQIVIRGSSVSQDASPLYVIDGFPIENMDINSLNPNDIESLEVLKDASSIAIYGARGANGVILITTKRGKAGPVRITYNMSMGVQRDTRRMKMMSPYEFVKLQLELDSITNTPAVPFNRFRAIYLGTDPNNTLESYRNVAGSDWQDLVLRQGSQATHSINLSGGNADTRFSLSGSIFDQKGIILNTGLKRYEGRFSIDQHIRSALKMGLSVSYANTSTYGTTPAGGNGGGVVQGMWQYRPVSGLGNQDLAAALIDSIAFQDFNSGNSTASLGDNLINPLLQAQNEYRNNITNTANLNAYLEYTFLKHFKLKVSGGFNGTQLRQETFYNSQTIQGNTFRNSAGGIANANGINGGYTNVITGNWLNENILSYRNRFGKNHSVDALVGYTYQYAKSSTFGFRAINIPPATEYLGIISLNTGTATTPTTGGLQWQLYSFLARANYAYKNRYLFTFSARSDGSSRFTPGKQWGYFPSGAFAWRFADEPFLKKANSVLSDGKLRVSYGSVGNNKVGDFSYLSQYGSLNTGHGYPFNNNYSLGIVPFFYGNDNLTWETTNEVDLGINLGFFNNRIEIEADYYDRRTRNFLLGVPLPFLAGYSNGANSQYQNTGNLRNSGVEFTLQTTNVQRKNFSWTTNFNISFNRSEILNYYNGLDSRLTAWGLPGGASAWVSKTGGPISQFYGYKWGGVYQFDDFDRLANGQYLLKNGVPTYSANVQPGDPRYVDLNGDGLVDANDQTTLGSPLPLHTGGFSNNFTYKNLSLNIFAQWSYGNKVLNANRIAFESTGGYFLNGNQFASYADRWTPSNPTNDIPRARYNLKGDAGSTNPRPSSRVIEDGSFLRLKTVQLTYNLPAAVAKKISANSIRVFGSAQNLFTWTRYSGVDPEVSTFRSPNPANSPIGGTGVNASTTGTGYTYIQPSSGYAVLAQGYDFTPYPRAITLTAGATITF